MADANLSETNLCQKTMIPNKKVSVAYPLPAPTCNIFKCLFHLARTSYCSPCIKCLLHKTLELGLWEHYLKPLTIDLFTHIQHIFFWGLPGVLGLIECAGEDSKHQPLRIYHPLEDTCESLKNKDMVVNIAMK